MRRFLLFLSLSFLFLAIMIQVYPTFFHPSYDLTWEYVNVKDIAEVSIREKKETSSYDFLSSLSTSLDSLYQNLEDDSSNKNKIVWEEVEFLQTSYSKQEVPSVVKHEFRWYLPTERGTITQYPSYYHPAYDIISPIGSNEVVFPVANGTISGIYRDNAGALVVSVLHQADGVYYTSLYVHLSRYASGLYVGKAVTIHDALGWMGATGIATGVHLHLSVADCSLFDPHDERCYDLNHFFQYIKNRVSEGYWGLGSHIVVPAHWDNRNGG